MEKGCLRKRISRDSRTEKQRLYSAPESGRKSQQRLGMIKLSFRLYLYFHFYEPLGRNSTSTFRKTLRFFNRKFFFPPTGRKTYYNTHTTSSRHRCCLVQIFFFTAIIIIIIVIDLRLQLHS